MSESERQQESHHRDAHERAVERLLQILEPDTVTLPAPRAVAEDEAEVAQLTRAYTETAAALAFAEPPVEPPAAVRENLLQVVRARATPAARPANVEPMTLPPARDGFRGSPWGTALAAMLGLCLLGLAFFAGRQTEGRAQQLAAATAVQPVTDIRTSPEYLALATQVSQLERNLHMVTTIARQVYPMRTATTASNDRLDGKVFVCGQHQQWYVNITGLAPPPSGQAYQLWFQTADGEMVPAGTLEVAPRRAAELADRAMPVGTKGFVVTLEPAANAGAVVATAPSSEPILVADRPVEI